jgi:hypothetical protein
LILERPVRWSRGPPYVAWHSSVGRGLSRGWWVEGGVGADERGERFDDRRLVTRRVSHQPLEGVDAAEPHLELVATELFDRGGVAVSGVGVPVELVPLMRVPEAERRAAGRAGPHPAPREHPPAHPGPAHTRRARHGRRRAGTVRRCRRPVLGDLRPPGLRRLPTPPCGTSPAPWRTSSATCRPNTQR